MVACEIGRKLGALVLALILAGAAPALAQPHEPDPSGPADAVAAADHADDEHAESPWAFIGRLVNFTLLAGTILYLLRRPLAGHLAARREQVRADLDAADRMKRDAAAQMAEMDARLKALPGELAAVKARGHQEIAAEAQRIRERAEAERARLVEQTRRDIGQHVRLARRELVEHAAALSVEVAARRIREQITDADQQRLVDRYLTQVRPS